MRFFAIDFYLWYAPAGTWLFVPPYPGPLKWGENLSQNDILACEAGLTFRVDNFLWLGDERDMFPLDLVYFELENTLVEDPLDEEISGRLPISEHLAIEIKQGSNNQILLSRFNTRKNKDHLEDIANFVGTYYKDFPVNQELWRSAVGRANDGLAIMFAKSQASVISPERESLAQSLLNRFQKLNN